MVYYSNFWKRGNVLNLFPICSYNKTILHLRNYEQTEYSSNMRYSWRLRHCIPFNVNTPGAILWCMPQTCTLHSYSPHPPLYEPWSGALSKSHDTSTVERKKNEKIYQLRKKEKINLQLQSAIICRPFRAIVWSPIKAVMCHRSRPTSRNIR